MKAIGKGWGFSVGMNFARAAEDTPIDIDEKASVYARAGTVYGTIKGNPDSRLGFMRGDSQGRVHVHVQRRALIDVEAPQ